MKKYLIALLAGVVIFPLNAATAAPDLTPDKAKELIAAFYTIFTASGKEGVREAVLKTTTSDWQDCKSNDYCISKEESIKETLELLQLIPDLRYAVKDVLVTGDRIVVRGELSGTPVRAAGDIPNAGRSFIGDIPNTGRSFRIMCLDIHVVRDGRLSRSWHLEDWGEASRQLRQSANNQ